MLKIATGWAGSTELSVERLDMQVICATSVDSVTYRLKKCNFLSYLCAKFMKYNVAYAFGVHIILLYITRVSSKVEEKVCTFKGPLEAHV